MRFILLLIILSGAVTGLYITSPDFFRSFALTSDVIIDDSAHIFTKDQKKYIDEYHNMLLNRFDFDYRIVTVKGKPNINGYAAKLFKDMKVGNRSKSNRGLLLLVDTETDLVRLEVSANLESVYTDSFVIYLERRQMVPFFKVNRIADGIFAMDEIIRIRAQDAKKGEKFDLAKVMGSIGGGATTKAQIGSGKDTQFQQGNYLLASTDPQETLHRYIVALAERNGRTDLDLFTPSTRKYMAGMLSTPAQMDSAVKRIKDCEVEHLTFNHKNTRAVLFHSLVQRHCDPFFFEKGNDGKWRLDLKTLGLGTGHTFGNIWYIHFAHYKESEIWKYNFGFRHVDFYRPSGEHGRFDHQGIPIYYQYGVDLNHVGGDMLVVNVVRGSFIDKMGLKKGDHIVEWEGKTFLHTNELVWRLDNVRPGLDISVLIRRGNKLIRKWIKAPPYPRNGQLRFGFTFRSPLPMFRGKPTRMAMVHYVEPRQQGEKLGLKQGDLILSWQGKYVPTMSEIYKIINQTKSGEKLRVEIYRNGQKMLLTSIAKPLRKMSEIQ